jgi:broad specificity phosphatase PhoE
MTILLVRHGETAGNASRILQRPDVPLNERGLRQADLLAQRCSITVSLTSYAAICFARV